MQGGHNIQVCHRVRPSINKERSIPCVTVVDNDTIVLNSKPEAKSFTVDKVRCKLGRCEAQAFVIASHNGLGVGDFNRLRAAFRILAVRSLGRTLHRSKFLMESPRM